MPDSDQLCATLIARFPEPKYPSVSQKVSREKLRSPLARPGSWPVPRHSPYSSPDGCVYPSQAMLQRQCTSAMWPHLPPPSLARGAAEHTQRDYTNTARTALRNTHAKHCKEGFSGVSNRNSIPIHLPVNIQHKASEPGACSEMTNHGRR